MEERQIILKQIEILQNRQEKEDILVDEIIRLSVQIDTLLSKLEKYPITE